jgi:hypothetical protein
MAPIKLMAFLAVKSDMFTGRGSLNISPIPGLPGLIVTTGALDGTGAAELDKSDPFRLLFVTVRSAAW